MLQDSVNMITEIKDYSFIYEKLLRKGVMEFSIAFNYTDQEIELLKTTTTPFEIFYDNQLEDSILDYITENDLSEGIYYMIGVIEFGKHPSTPNDSGEYYSELDIIEVIKIK